MRYLRGVTRLAIIFVVVIGLGIISLFLLQWVPYKRHGIPFKAWFVGFLAKSALWICGIRVLCKDKAAFYQHKGFVFTNHVSYLDILVKIAIMPMRFLAKAEVRKMPFIGWAADTIGCVFVRRDKKSSRKAAREALKNVDFTIPMVLYPEGTVNRLDSGIDLKPFRIGAFEIAAENETPFLPATITYDPPEVARLTTGESNLAGAWRMVTYPGRVTATITPHTVVTPSITDNASSLSEETHHVMLSEIQQFAQLIG